MKPKGTQFIGNIYRFTDWVWDDIATRKPDVVKTGNNHLPLPYKQQEETTVTAIAMEALESRVSRHTLHLAKAWKHEPGLPLDGEY